MQLFDLPLELLREILGWAVAVRGTKRGLRLRLVNKTFSSEIITALIQFKLLDTTFNFSYGTPLPSIATTYLERRILNERSGGAPQLLWIRNVAKQLSRETEDGRDEHEYIRQLCPLVLGTQRWTSDHTWIYDTIERAPKGICEKTECARNGFCDSHFFDEDVFAAALYTQTLPVVTRWISSGKRGRELLIQSRLFGISRRHAVMHRNHKVLAAMMDIDHVGNFHQARTWLLLTAAEFGYLDLMQFIWDFQTVQHPWVCKKRGTPKYQHHNYLTVVDLNAPSREIFDWIMEKRRIHIPQEQFDAQRFSWFLDRCVQKGWVDMTAHYLSLGAPVDGECYPNGVTPSARLIVGASWFGHTEVVKVLLGYGADTGRPALAVAVRYGHFDVFYLLLEHGAETGRALAVAVAKGYRSIVNVLLERGGHTKEHLQSLLPRAIETEDKAIFQTLAKHVEIDDATRAECAKVAEENGLESMAELL